MNTPWQARDVMAFGRDFGRALSDGNVVGRSEPFAKVFPSSRLVKRAVGLLAWGVLEDIALDAEIDERGRLVSRTNVRRIADNLALSKTTVNRHLAKLREYGFVLHEEHRDEISGRYDRSQYVIDPTACIERFTTTPTAARPTAGSTPHPSPPAATSTARDVATRSSGLAGDPHRDTGNGDTAAALASAATMLTSGDVSPQPADGRAGKVPPSSRQPGGHDGTGAASEPGTNSWDTDAAAPVSQNLVHGGDPVYQFTGHGDLVQQEQDVVVLEDPTTRARVARDLEAIGITAAVAAELAAAHSPQRVRDVLDAAEVHQPLRRAGWVVRALRDSWDVAQAAERARRVSAGQERAEQRRLTAEADDERQRAESAAATAWDALVSAVLDDELLAQAVRGATTPVAGLRRRSVGVTRTQLLAWAMRVVDADPGDDVASALRVAVGQLPDRCENADTLPDVVAHPPRVPDAATPIPLTNRLRRLLPAIDAMNRTTGKQASG